MANADSIEGSGFPLGFEVSAAGQRPSVLGPREGRETYVVEARKLPGHQKEAVVREGAEGGKWRLTSDEGKHLKGTDLAPFPLGFFNAGLHGDLIGRLLALAKDRSIEIADLELDLKNGYWMTGSFFKGDGEGFAEPATAHVSLQTAASAEAIGGLVSDAVTASPALAAMRQALTNSFALYINGRRREVATMTPSTADDAADPYVTYSAPPSPLANSTALSELIHKTGVVQDGEIALAPAGTKTRIIRKINGLSRLEDNAGVTRTDTWLELPGMSHFSLKSDERIVEQAGIAHHFRHYLNFRNNNGCATRHGFKRGKPKPFIE